MSWTFGEVNGRQVGYGVPSVCQQSGCSVAIDCGLAYVCGGEHGGGNCGCGDYFCYEHLLVGKDVQLCSTCYDAAPEEMGEEE